MWISFLEALAGVLEWISGISGALRERAAEKRGEERYKGTAQAFEEREKINEKVDRMPDSAVASELRKLGR